MHSRTIKFEDLDGNPVEEEFWFHLSKGELAELHLGVKGGSLADLIKEIIADEDGEQIIANFKKIIAKSVGRKDPNNKRFIKTEDLTQNFMQSDAYSELFLKLVTDAEAAAEFIRLVVPANLSGETEVLKNMPPAVQRLAPQQGSTMDLTRARTALAKPPNDVDLANMSREELQAAFEKIRQQQING